MIKYLVLIILFGFMSAIGLVIGMEADRVVNVVNERALTYEQMLEDLDR